MPLRFLPSRSNGGNGTEKRSERQTSGGGKKDVGGSTKSRQSLGVPAALNANRRDSFSIIPTHQQSWAAWVLSWETPQRRKWSRRSRSASFFARFAMPRFTITSRE